MGTTLATYYAKLQDMPDSEYNCREKWRRYIMPALLLNP